MPEAAILDEVTPIALREIPGPILLAGAGKMGGALLTGWLDAGLDPARIMVQDPNPPADVADLCRRRGIRCGDDPDPGRRTPPAVLIAAVKPQVMDAVFPGLAARAADRALTISIAAGRTIQSFAAQLPDGAPIVRAMPNTPAAIGRGITAMVANAAATQRDVATAGALLGAVGEVVILPDESLMDAVTAVSGSGPAYVFLLVEAMAKAGVAAGLEPAVAMTLARTTVAGSGALLAHSTLEAETLRNNVTSPGGTTAAALSVLMEDDALAGLLKAAILRAAARSRELSC